MQLLKRLASLFAAGFVTVAGGMLALYFAMDVFDKRSEAAAKAKYGIDPRNYQKPADGQITLKDVKLAKLTTRGGVFGSVENKSKRPLRSFNADLTLSRAGEVVHRCAETATISSSVPAGESGTFQLLCSDLDRNKLTDDLSPTLSINWVYPSLDE